MIISMEEKSSASKSFVFKDKRNPDDVYFKKMLRDPRISADGHLILKLSLLHWSNPTMRRCLNELQKGLLCEDKTHRTGLTMSDPDILVPNEPSWSQLSSHAEIEGKTHNIL